MRTCNSTETENLIKNFCYKNESIDTLLNNHSVANEHTACYLSLYPLELLFKIASCVSSGNYKTIHFHQGLSSQYLAMCTATGIDAVIDVATLSSLKLAAQDIHMRYDISINHTSYGYSNLSELQTELQTIKDELIRLQCNYFSQIGGVAIC
jgi:hypothetical protein